MVWRQEYSTWTAESPAVPELVGEGGWVAPDDGAVVVALSAAAWRDVEIWRRLVEADAPGAGFALALVPGARVLAEALPPSRRRDVGMLGAGWSMDVPASASCVALARRGGATVLAMAGPPTEDAWERFARALCDNDLDFGNV